MQAMALGSEENVSPWDALLLAVKRRAARVRYCDEVAEHVVAAHKSKCDERSVDYDAEYAAVHDPDVPPREARDWLMESRNEERLMTRAAKMAVDAGVADAMIRRVEREGQLMMDAMLAALDVLGLTQDQRLMALEAMHTKIALSAPNPRVIEGNVEPDA
jgi:hypothetical protein